MLEISLLDLSFGVGTLLILLVIIRAGRNRPSFDLADIITGDNGRVSGSKSAAALACFASTWVLIHVTDKDLLQEWVFFGYLVAFTGASLGTKFIEKGQVTSSVTSTTTTTQAPAAAAVVVPVPAVAPVVVPAHAASTVYPDVVVNAPAAVPAEPGTVLAAAQETVAAAASTVDAAIAEQKKDLS